MKINISIKILRAVLVVSFLVMSGWGAINFFYDKENSSKELRRQTEMTADRLGYALANPFWNLDEVEIGLIMDYEVKSDKVRAVILRKEDGRIFTGKIRGINSKAIIPSDASETDLERLNNSYFSSSAKVVKDSAQLGTVTVYADDSSLKALLRQRLYMSIVGIIVLCIGLSAALYLVLRRSIVKPLKSLEESVSQISISNLAVPITTFGNDEISHLADRFREMTVELKSSLDQQKRNEEQLLQAQKMEAVGMLVGGVSHDFNNILSAVFGATEFLERLLSKENLLQREKIEKHVKTIKDAGGRAAALIRQLLTLAMKQEMTLAAVDLNDTVRHVVELLQSSLDKSIEMTVELPDTPAVVNSDMTQMEQMLLNLCINAGHAMTFMRPDGDTWGGKLHISVKKMPSGFSFKKDVQATHSGGCWLLSVEDSGIGMDSVTKEKIFTPFFTTKQKGKGSGLGLSMVYSIITQHGGELTVYSEPGFGSTFHILLPECNSENGDSAQDNPDCSNAPVSGGSGTILVVDDDESIRDIASQILTECGYTVIMAHNGAEGVRLAREHCADIRLVLLDMIMPVMSGMDALSLIKVAAPDAKVLLSSGFKQDPRVVELLNNKLVDDFIQKPYHLSQLVTSIQTILCPQQSTNQ